MVPRRAGTTMLEACWVAAARCSVLASTSPSQPARPAARRMRARKTAKRKPMRRSIEPTIYGPGAVVVVVEGAVVASVVVAAVAVVAAVVVAAVVAGAVAVVVP